MCKTIKILRCAVIFEKKKNQIFRLALLKYVVILLLFTKMYTERKSQQSKLISWFDYLALGKTNFLLGYVDKK